MITCLGVLIMDMFPSETGVRLKDVAHWKPVCGGAPANVAVANARLGGKSSFIGKVGNDAFGEKLREALVVEHVNDQGLCIDPFARTTMNFHSKPSPDVIEYCFYRNPGADTRLQKEEICADLIADAAFLHYDSLCLTDEPTRGTTAYAVEIARKNNTLVSFDLNYREPLWSSVDVAVEAAQDAFRSADIVKINETEAEILVGGNDYKAAARKLLSYGVKLVVVTLGKEGSYYATRDYEKVIPTRDIKVVDAIGCGDSFIGAVLNRLDLMNEGIAISNEEMEEVFRFADAAARLTAQKVGVFSSMPTLAEVEDLIRSEVTEL